MVPVADAYVQSGMSSTIRFGLAPNLLVKFEPLATDFYRAAYLRFDLAGLPTISSASLELTLINRGQPEPFENGVFAVPNTTWQEATIDFTNAPAVGAQLATFAAPPDDTSVTVNVSGTVRDAQRGNARVSFSVQSLFDQGGTAISTYSSREGNHPPRLRLSF